ncbi:MAG: hypothetical protein IT373_19160 [Polyangiaceae bacterium]|nr:hypothetical protein [Polyangiaceae bacterium]
MTPASPLSVASERSGRATLRQLVEQHRAEPLAPVLGRRGLGAYRGYAELLGAVDRLVQTGARLATIGRSVRGEPLFALTVGAEPAPHRRTSVVLAGLHPIEWIGVETALALVGQLLESRLGDRSVVVVPIANPDGLLRVERNLRARRFRFVRHNAHGVDLNRNFDAHWGLGRRTVPWVFKPGAAPSSEPEVQAIAQALGTRRVDRAVSFHSFGGAVLYPHAYSLLPAPDAAEHRAWARRIAAAADPRPYRALPSSWFGVGLRQGGLELDWFHERHGALSLLVECSRGGVGLRPGRLFDPFAWFNPPNTTEVAGRIATATLPFARGDRL